MISTPEPRPTVVALPHGLQAELHEADWTDALIPRVRPLPRRRWGKNGHLWQRCGCFECFGRRLGGVPEPYPPIKVSH